METKKHFKMYKSGKLWVYAAIATISLATGVAVSTNNAHAAVSSADQPVTSQAQVTGQSAQSSSASAAVDTVAATAAAQPVQQGSAAFAAAGDNQQSASNSQSSLASAASRNVTLNITYRYNDDSHPASSSPQTATYTKQANGKWTTEKGWSDVKVTPPAGYAAQMVVNNNSQMLTSGQTIPIEAPSADDPQSQTIIINYLKLRETASITRTINVVAPDGKKVQTPKSPSETINIERDLDPSNGKYGDWKVTSGDGWSSFQPSTLDGYVVEIDENGHVLNNNGNLATVVPGLVSGQSTAFKGNHPQNVTITVNYRKFVPNASQKKTVTRTIIITEPNGQKQALTTQSVVLQLQEATDSQGKVIAQRWTTGQWAAYDLPALNGYVIQQMDNKTIITTVSAEQVTSDTKDTTVNLAYVTDSYNQDIDKNLKGNWAWLDHIDIKNNALHVIGWNANSYSQGRGYHYLIVLADGHEVGRVLVKQVIRQDVKDHYKVWNAATSGFDELIPLNFAEMNPGAKLTLISRWTSDKAGNIDNNPYNKKIDHWFSPYTPNYNQNVAYLDNFTIDNNSIHVTGWNATADSINLPIG